MSTTKSENKNKKKVVSKNKSRKNTKKTPATLDSKAVALDAVKKDKMEGKNQNPAVMQLLQYYKSIAFRWNQIAQHLGGQVKLAKDLSDKDHAKWLAQVYYSDVLFLLEQLGVVKVTNEETDIALTDNDNKVDKTKTNTNTNPIDEAVSVAVASPPIAE
jgi:hypothetical protein